MGLGVLAVAERAQVLHQTTVREATLCLLVRGDPFQQVCLGYKKAGFGTGKWTGFGGKVEAGESPAAAAIRELAEETGIATQAGDLEKMGDLSFLFPFRTSWSQRVHVYLVTVWEGEPHESPEMKPRWFAVDNLPLDDMWQDGRHWLPQILAGKRVRATFRFAADNETILELVTEPWEE